MGAVQLAVPEQHTGFAHGLEPSRNTVLRRGSVRHLVGQQQDHTPAGAGLLHQQIVEFLLAVALGRVGALRR